MSSFKLFADTHVGLRENNEDNFTVCPDLGKTEWIPPINGQEVIPLAENGCLLVVADGMGGQNAGEVASAIAIETVQQMFLPTNLTTDVIGKPDNIKSFLKKVIVEADDRIKKHTQGHPETEGMGSTIVIAWIIADSVYVAWLGDSRAYCIVPDKGIGRLTKDHSFVQQLVDTGKLTDEQAMNHPDSNIITRSLGDTSQKAQPEVMRYPLEKGMIILLCSDGLCGVCSDEIIGGIVEEKHSDLSVCKDELTTAALTTGGSDNITIALFEVIEMEAVSESSCSSVDEKKTKDSFIQRLNIHKVWWFILLLIIIVGLSLSVCFYSYECGECVDTKDSVTIVKDTIKTTKEAEKNRKRKGEYVDSAKKNEEKLKGSDIEAVIKTFADKEKNDETINDTSSLSVIKDSTEGLNVLHKINQ